MTQQLMPKTLIWDLGGTLLSTSKFGMARSIGLGDFILYPLFEAKSPLGIQDKVFDILNNLPSKSAPSDLTTFSPDGRKLPLVMQDWLAGLESGESITQRAKAYIDTLAQEQKFYFSGERERRLVENTITAIFDPHTFVKNTEIIKPGMRLLQECFSKKDAAGNPLHRMMVLSNWDPISFNLLYNSAAGAKLFPYFNPQDIIISGTQQLIKPDGRLFAKIMHDKKLDPKNCILIDDQQENCQAARDAGMDAVFLEKGNYKKLQQELAQRGVC